MREGTTSRLTGADRPYGEFYDFYSVSPENFGSTLVYVVLVVRYYIDKVFVVEHKLSFTLKDNSHV
jgi:hypothetical protein